MIPGNVALMVLDVPMVVQKPVEAADFESMDDVKVIVKRLNLPVVNMTAAAWTKLEGLYASEQ